MSINIKGATISIPLGLVLASTIFWGCTRSDEDHEGMHPGMHEEQGGKVDASGAGMQEASPPDVDLSDYPLDVCVVSGQKLGAMGKPVAIEYEGRKVVFCCKGCVADFKKDPAKYLAKLDAAEKKSPDQ